ncbi:MAG: sigma-70 family RNA polymerase sigma factor [Bacteroidetes bacterium]|nr:sigma-70 family RNA polymerase sigma factor [Bacteroidota bacterium]
MDNKIIIEGIRNQDKQILKNIYQTYFSTIKRMVMDNYGSEQDAKDVFQEGIIIIYRKAKEGNINLTSSFKSYIYGVCRYIWKKQLTQRKENTEKLEGYVEYEVIPDVTFDEYEKNEQYKLYQKHFKRLEKDCQKVLQLFLKKVPLKDIAEIMGIESQQYVKRKKYKCKEQLVRYIKNDPKFREQ